MTICGGCGHTIEWEELPGPREPICRWVSRDIHTMGKFDVGTIDHIVTNADGKYTGGEEHYPA